MARVKALIATVMCGLSTFTIMPNTNYFQHISPDAASITNAAWQRTGRNMKKAMDKVGGCVESEKCSRQEKLSK